MKIRKIFISTLLALGLTACGDYLDIVPDNTVDLDSIFETKDKAYHALADAYSFMPNWEAFHNSLALMGDEWIGRLDSGVANTRAHCRGIKIMRGWNNSSDPIMGYWGGYGGASNLYEGIRSCNIFLNSLGEDIPNFSVEERADWIAQVKILKAYYHFYLLRMYGPISSMYVNREPNDPASAILQRRRPVEECFQYVLGLIDEVLYNADGTEKNDLYETRSSLFYGQIDRVIAKALKAKILLYRASPFFNGNSEYYSTFRNEAGEHYFPQTYDKEKWKEALDALEIAIAAAADQGKNIYEYSGQPKFWDAEDYESSEIMKYCYNNRFSINDPWNSELVWGYSNLMYTNAGSFSHASQVRGDVDNPGNASFSYQWLGSTYRMTELFYSKNGVPIDEDKTFPYEHRHDGVTIPDDDYHRGYMQAGEKTIQLHLNREPRFYAWVAVDRCVWRTFDTRLNMLMRSGEFPGGRQSNHATDYYWTGIAVKKYVHPESKNGAWQRVVNFPYPLIRMADLYLSYAEAYNEYYGPDQKAYDKINAVRRRAGLRDVEDVWNDSSIVSEVGKHRTQDGLRDIIHTERMIELSYEGQRYWDICRWKRAEEFFTTPIQGWYAPDGSTFDDFFVLTTWQQREWTTPKSYLHPIPDGEINKNPKVDQNPGY